MGQIGKFLLAQNDDVLLRLAEEPLGECVQDKGPGCIMQIVTGRRGCEFIGDPIARRYDDIAYRISTGADGFAVVALLVKRRAQAILDARHRERLNAAAPLGLPALPDRARQMPVFEHPSTDNSAARTDLTARAESGASLPQEMPA